MISAGALLCVEEWEDMLSKRFVVLVTDCVGSGRDASQRQLEQRYIYRKGAFVDACREHCLVPSCGGNLLLRLCASSCHCPYEGFIWTPRQEREALLFEMLVDAAELLVLVSRIDKNKACSA